MAKKTKPKWQLVFKGKIEDFNSDISLEYWKERSVSEKFSEVSRLIKQAQAIRGVKDFDGSKFLRSTAVLRRV